jgi:hypothetical protein
VRRHDQGKRCVSLPLTPTGLPLDIRRAPRCCPICVTLSRSWWQQP